MIDVFYMMLLSLPMACFGYFVGLVHAGRFKKRTMKASESYGWWNVIDDDPQFNCRCVPLPNKKDPDGSVIERNRRITENLAKTAADFSGLIAVTNKDPSK